MLRSLVLLVIALVACAASRLDATPYRFAEDKCTIVLPDSGWSVDAMGSSSGTRVLLAARNIATGRSVILFVTTLREAVSIETPGFLRGIDSSIRSRGTIIRVTTTRIAGVPARLIAASERKGGTSLVLFTAANGLAYTVAAYSRKGDAEHDPELSAIVSSFAFIGAPHVDPQATARGIAAPSIWQQVAELGALIAFVGIAGYFAFRRFKRP